MSRVEELLQLPLMECPACGRLEFCPRELIPCGLDRPCPCLDAEFVFVRKSANLEFEAIGQHFYRDTGFVRPGKDCRKHDFKVRQEAFNKWNNGGAMKIDNDAIDAKLKKLAADRKVCELETLSFVDMAQDGKRFDFLRACTNGGHFNEERQELVWTFHIPAKRMHGNITSAVDHARFADEKA